MNVPARGFILRVKHDKRYFCCRQVYTKSHNSQPTDLDTRATAMLTHYDPLPLHIYTARGRFYQVDGQHFPGVGTVLSTSDSPAQQEFWRKWRLHPENPEFSAPAKNRGKLFHGIVENYFRRGNFRMDSQAQEPVLALPYW